MNSSFNSASASVSDSVSSMHVVARVGEERFGFRVIDVEEAIDAPRLIHVANAPPGLIGQFVHRERTVSAFDAGWMFDVKREGKAATALVLRVSYDRIALLVDDVEDLTGIDDAEVRAVPAGTDPSGLLRGVWLPSGRETRDPSFSLETRVELGVHAATRDSTPQLTSKTRVSRLASLVCLVNAVAVMSRGASVVAPAMTGA